MPNRLLPFSKTALLFSLAIAGLTPCLVTAQSAGTTRVAAPSEQNISDAYVYLLGRVLVIRQEHTDLKEPGIHFNMIKYNPLGSADFVNPNLDVAYLEAWFAVDDKTPVILEVPKIEGRYYTAQILDEWGEVIANINERTFPSKPYGKFALLKPGSTARTPKDAARIELHSSKAKMLARVELKGDPDGAVKLQKQFKVTAMGKPVIKPAPPLPAFSNKDLIGVAIFDDVDTRLNSALDVSPVAAAMHKRFVRSPRMWRPARKPATRLSRKSVPKCCPSLSSMHKARPHPTSIIGWAVATDTRRSATMVPNIACARRPICPVSGPIRPARQFTSWAAVTRKANH